MSNPNEELITIITKFAESGWDLIDIPSKTWLTDRENPDASEAVRLELIRSIEKADEECGSCGCEYDTLYKRALVLFKL